MMEEEEREETRMYELSEREREKERKVVEEWSWDVERRESGSTGQGVEKRRGDEKDARLERAAELLGRQGKVEVSDETEYEVVEERRVVV
jgi:hypothetical protein